MFSPLHRPLLSLLLLAFLPLAPARAQVGQDGYLAPLTLVDSQGETLLGEDWRIESPFCVLLLVDRAAEGDYALDELEMTRRLSEWGELEPGFLAVREVCAVPEDGPETRHDRACVAPQQSGTWHQGLSPISSSVNARATLSGPYIARWMPSGA